MKLVKTASGKTKIKMSRSEWTEMGKQAGWIGSSENNQSGWLKQAMPVMMHAEVHEIKSSKDMEPYMEDLPDFSKNPRQIDNAISISSPFYLITNFGKPLYFAQPNIKGYWNLDGLPIDEESAEWCEDLIKGSLGEDEVS
jgi:hypothetical protein